MKRRSFLQALVGIAGTTAISATGSTRATTKPTPIQLLETDIAGFQYYEGKQLFAQLKINDPLQLRRAPKNKYDTRAVEVYWQEKMLGHIPKIANMSVSQMLDKGERLEAKISRIVPEKIPVYCVSLRINLYQV